MLYHQISRNQPDSFSISSSIWSEPHIYEILRIGGIKCERELCWLITCPIPTPVLVVIVVLNTEPVSLMHVKSLAEKTELGTKRNIKIPPTQALSAIGVVAWVVGCL